MFWMFAESARHSSAGMVTLDWPGCVIDFSHCSIIHFVCRLAVELQKSFVYLFVFVFIFVFVLYVFVSIIHSVCSLAVEITSVYLFVLLT